eukprot:IDg13722t1
MFCSTLRAVACIFLFNAYSNEHANANYWKQPKSRCKIFFLCALLVVVRAHMGLSPQTATGGSRQELSLRISHDCGDDTVGTTNFTIALPLDPPMLSVKVEMSMWRVMIKKVKLDPPVKVGKYTFNETVGSVTWLGFLPDGFYNTFKIRGIVPDVKKNTTIWFKGYQDCHNQGHQVKWASIPSKSEPKPRYPARGLTVTPKTPACMIVEATNDSNRYNPRST